MIETSPSHRDRNIIIIEVAVLTIITAAVFMTGSATTTGPSQKNTIVVLSGSTAINPGSSYSRQFIVPPGATNVRIEGSFTASGGSLDDIKVYVMTANNYANWEVGHAVSTYYDSGEISTGLINAVLSPGETYYLVFDNTYSLFAGKTVYSTITLTYNYLVSTSQTN